MKTLFLALLLIASPAAFALTFDASVPADIKTQMIDDLNFMYGIQGTDATPLHKQIFGQAVEGSNYKNFFETRVLKVGKNGCGNGNAVACVIPMLSNSKIFITDNYIKFSHPQIARLMVVYHESRHTEVKNGNWSHANCPSNFIGADGKEIKSIWTGAVLANEPACDVTAFGSYGSSTILLKNVQKFCASCSEKVKMDAGMYADDQMKRIIDKKAKDSMIADFAI